MKVLRISVIIAVLLSTILLLLDALYPPDLSKLNDQASVVSDRDGRPLRAFANSQGVWRYPTQIDKVSPDYLQALFTYEDRHFYYHPGVNPFSMIRAVAQAAYYGRAISGGSTITMQVARLLHPNKRNVPGKIYQMLRAFQLEWRYSKQEILTFYLNIAPFGGPIEGIEAASFVYFDKPAIELTRNEASLLAVLPQSPSRYRPDRYPERARLARNKLLRRLATFDVWSQAEIDTLISDPIYADYFPHPRLAPILARRLKNQRPSPHIKTFIDGDLQEQLENQVKSYASTLPANSSVAAMVMHAHSGEVSAYIGSADFDNAQRQGQVDMINAVRSPGSTLKPFVYGAAIEQGIIHEQSLLQDVPLIKGSYRPGNFSGGFSGPVSTKDALLRSLNLPVLQVLNHTSVNALAARLNNGGLTLHWPQNATPNPALILGGVGVKLEQLVSAYSSLLNQGQSVSPRYRHSDAIENRFLLEPGSAWIIQNILRQQQAPNRVSSQVISDNNQSNIGWKTGTSYGFRDAWVIGFSGPYIIGIWTGRPDAMPVVNNSGSEHALPLFLQIASRFTTAFIPEKPTTVSETQTCWPGGQNLENTPTKDCHQQHTSVLYQQMSPPTLSLSPQLPAPLKFEFWQEPNGSRATIGCASENATKQSIQLWPQALHSWLKPDWQTQQLLPTLSASCTKQQTAQVTKNIAAFDFHITSIKPGSRFVRRQASQALSLDFKSTASTQQVYWFLNGKRLTTPNATFNVAGNYQLLALAQDGRVDSVEFIVE